MRAPDESDHPSGVFLMSARVVVLATEQVAYEEGREGDGEAWARGNRPGARGDGDGDRRDGSRGR